MGEITKNAKTELNVRAESSGLIQISQTMLADRCTC